MMKMYLRVGAQMVVRDSPNQQTRRLVDVAGLLMDAVGSTDGAAEFQDAVLDLPPDWEMTERFVQQWVAEYQRRSVDDT